MRFILGFLSGVMGLLAGWFGLAALVIGLAGPDRDGGVAMGAFDAPTDTRLRIHIHVADKGDYYDIGVGLPQNQQ